MEYSYVFEPSTFVHLQDPELAFSTDVLTPIGARALAATGITIQSIFFPFSFFFFQILKNVELSHDIIAHEWIF